MTVDVQQDGMVTSAEPFGAHPAPTPDHPERRNRGRLDQVPAPIAMEVVALRECVDHLADAGIADLDGPAAEAVMVELRHLADRLTAVALPTLPGLEADGRWALDGARSFPVWLARRTGAPVTAARRDVRLARSLRDEIPATARALTEGSVGIDNARTIAAVATTESRREALAATSGCNEEFLLRNARTLGADHFRQVARRWAAAADPGADERGYRDAAEREFVELSRTIGGYHLAGFLTEEHGQVLATAFSAVTGVPPQGDERTSAQRRAHALTDLARLVLDRGLAGAGAAVRPHLSVHVQLADLVQLGGPSASVAAFDDGTPVPRSLLDRIACDSEVTRIVFGPPGVVLDVGRTERTVTRELRRAVIARDRHCQFPDCHAPPPQCEVHHPHHWCAGGVTSVCNSALLCHHHHDWVHRTGITIEMVDGRWQFRDRHGGLLGVP